MTRAGRSKTELSSRLSLGAFVAMVIENSLPDIPFPKIISLFAKYLLTMISRSAKYAVPLTTF
jgi:hypothetical protein